MSEMVAMMAEGCYRAYYRERMALALTRPQKEAVAKRISELTLERAIWQDHKTDFSKQFPELDGLHTAGLTGLFLVAIMKEIVADLHGPLPGVTDDKASVFAGIFTRPKPKKRGKKQGRRK